MEFRQFFPLCKFFPTPNLTALLLACTFAMAGTAGPVQAEIRLTFGTYAANKPTDTVRMFKPVLRSLETALTEMLSERVVIRMQVSNNYSRGIDQLVQGKVDFACFGPASYIVAKKQSAGINILAMEASNGKKIYYGVISVRQNSDIKTLNDLKGKSFAFGDELSTIGRYLAQSMLLDVGIGAAELARFSYLGRHDRVGTAVGSGRFDAGALKLTTFNKLKNNYVAIRELQRFEIVTKPWIGKAGLESRIFKALSKALLAIKDPAVLVSLDKMGFLAGTDADFDAIRSAMKRSEDFGY